MEKENTNEPVKKENHGSTIYWVFGIVVVTASLLFWAWMKTTNAEMKKKDETIQLLSKGSQKLQTLYTTTVTSKDSLTVITKMLSKYRGLTEAMSYRDSIRKPLSYSIGTVVMLKADSTRVVIKDILTGGGKFDYYIKYQVLRKDNSTELVSPELIY